MTTTLIPMNTAQIGNTLTDLGTYIGAYFPAFLGLALFFAALIIVFIVVKGILNWIIDGIERITTKRDLAAFSSGKMTEQEFIDKHYRGE